jgi:hypothetical protein
MYIEAAEAKIRIDSVHQMASVIDVAVLVTGRGVRCIAEAVSAMPDVLKDRCRVLESSGDGPEVPYADASTLADIISYLYADEALAASVGLYLPGHAVAAIRRQQARNTASTRRLLAYVLRTEGTPGSCKEQPDKQPLPTPDYAADSVVQTRRRHLDNPSHQLSRLVATVDALFPPENSTVEHAPALGYVFFIRITNTGMMRIGSSTNPIEHRMSQLRVDNTHGLGILAAAVETPRYKEIENDLRLLLESSRVRGRWFAMDPEVGNEFLLEQVGMFCH